MFIEVIIVKGRQGTQRWGEMGVWVLCESRIYYPFFPLLSFFDFLALTEKSKLDVFP